mgnify:CR=1 FL=1
MLRVTVKNTTKIMTMLAAANGRAARHTYTTFREIERIAERSERKLEKLDIPKKLRVGAAVTATSGLDVPNAYKWSRKATHVGLCRRATGWFLSSVIKVEPGTDGCVRGSNHAGV